MLNNVLGSKWKNLSLQVLLFIILSTGSFYASQYVANIDRDSFLWEFVAAAIFLAGGVGCVWVSIVMDNKYFEISGWNEILNNNNNEDK
jgi:hypothetical protein